MKRCIIRERGIFRPRVYWFEYINDDKLIANIYPTELNNNEVFQINVLDIHILEDNAPIINTDNRHHYLNMEYFYSILNKISVGGAN